MPLAGGDPGCELHDSPTPRRRLAASGSHRTGRDQVAQFKAPFARDRQIGHAGDGLGRGGAGGIGAWTGQLGTHRLGQGERKDRH